MTRAERNWILQNCIPGKRTATPPRSKTPPGGAPKAKAKAKAKTRGRSGSRGRKAKAAPADAVSAERANGKPQKDYRPRWGGLLACFQYRDHGTCDGKECKGQTLYAHVTKETYERELKKLLEQKKRDISARRTAAPAALIDNPE